MSSKLGGCCLVPDPLPLFEPPPGGAPQGDWFLKILSLKLIALYIVTFASKTSYVTAIL